jgi:hypothetical protein
MLLPALEEGLILYYSWVVAEMGVLFVFYWDGILHVGFEGWREVVLCFALCSIVSKSYFSR